MVFWNFPKETWQTNNLFSGTYKIVPLVWFKYLVRSFASDSNKQTRKSTFAAIHSQKTESSKHLTKSRREDVTDSKFLRWSKEQCFRPFRARRMGPLQGFVFPFFAFCWKFCVREHPIGLEGDPRSPRVQGWYSGAEEGTSEGGDWRWQGSSDKRREERGAQ